MLVNFKEIHTKSNYLSLFRLFLAIPLWILADKIPQDETYKYVILGIMILGIITDVLDGWLARKFDEITEIGKIIDPLADKVAIGTIILKLYLIGEIPEFYFWVIIFRDLIIFVGGILVSKFIGKVLPSNLLGKLTVLSIGFYLMGLMLNSPLIPWLYNFLYYFSLIMSFASVIGYGIRGYESIMWKKKNETV